MTGANGGAGPSARPEWRWDVALSFAGAQRDYVEQVARALQTQGARCFYDADEQIELWGKYLAEELPAIYGEQAAAVVVFVSAEYAARTGPVSSAGLPWLGRCGSGGSTCCPPGSTTRPCPGCCRTLSRSTYVAGRRSSSRHDRWQAGSLGHRRVDRRGRIRPGRQGDSFRQGRCVWPRPTRGG